MAPFDRTHISEVEHVIKAPASRWDKKIAADLISEMEAFFGKVDTIPQMKQALADWTSEFEQEHGRRPNRTDLSEHPVGAPLFKRFALATKIGTVMD